MTKSSQWDLETIIIDNNWSATATIYDWCTGSGTKNEPYLLEEISFSTGYPHTSIVIRNTSEYFEIRKCVFIDCNKGIRLTNVSNGIIVSNSFTETYSTAIYLVRCRDVGISNNMLYGGQTYHIIIDSCISLNVTTNLIDTIGGTNYGILLESVNNSHIEHNIVDFTGGTFKIALFQSNYNLIFNNSLINSGGSGLLLYNSLRNLILNNTIEDCSDGIVVTQNSVQNKLKNNFIDTRLEGIYIRGYSHNNSIQFNNIYNAQITITRSNLSNVSLNLIKNPFYGINLIYSNKSIIFNNTFYHYIEKCIREYNCVNNVISGNICLPIPPNLSPFYTFMILLSVMTSLFVILFICGRIRRRSQS